MKQNPQITVVTVCYNAEKDIEATMRSVLNQTYENIEYIIVDGASKDDTVHIAERVVQDYSKRVVKILSEPDKGLYDAMNKGALLATGEYINYMNAGDVFHSPDAIKKLFFEANEDDDLILGSSYHKLRDKLYLKRVRILDNGFPDGICHQSLFTRTSVMRENPFNLNYKIAADFDFEYKMAMANKFHYIDIPVSIMDVNEGASVNNRVKVCRELAHIQGKNLSKKTLLNAYIRDTFYKIPFMKELRLFLLSFILR